MNDPDDDLRELADWLRTSSSAEWCSKPLERAADAIDELLELRVKVAAGPVMPEVLSDAVANAYNNTTFYPEVSAQQAYHAFRAALLKEQGK